MIYSARHKRIAEVRGKEEWSAADTSDLPRHRDLEGLHAGTTRAQDEEVREVQEEEVHHEDGDGVTMGEDRQTGGRDGEEKEERGERNWEEGENRFVLVV